MSGVIAKGELLSHIRCKSAAYTVTGQLVHSIAVIAGLDRATCVRQNQVHELQWLQAQVQCTKVYRHGQRKGGGATARDLSVTLKAIHSAICWGHAAVSLLLLTDQTSLDSCSWQLLMRTGPLTGY